MRPEAEGKREEITFRNYSYELTAEGLDSRRGLRALVARGRGRPPEVRSVPLVLQVRLPTHKKTRNARMDIPCFLAGAEGLEPTTHGFGVSRNARKPLKMLAFSRVSTTFTRKIMCRDCV